MRYRYRRWRADYGLLAALEDSRTSRIAEFMVIGNFMLLNEIKPDNVFKWFMELYADAYLWVMKTNIEMCKEACTALAAVLP